MENGILGLHHVSAIAGGVGTNVAFYTDVLGLRLVKKTVNFDSPQTYHLYYGDELGRPGTILTFFPLGQGRRGRIGNGQATATAFSVPPQSLAFWQERLRAYGATFTGPQTRFAEQVLTVRDPDGLAIELIAHEEATDRPGWPDGPVSAEHAIRGFYGVTLSLQNAAVTAAILTEAMGFRTIGTEGERTRYQVGDGTAGGFVDLLDRPTAQRGITSIGTVHHVAFRVSDAAAFDVWYRRLAVAGLRATEVKDRNYFQSVYFREPGGVLFELATDAPGFAIDESADALGANLMLPAWLESSRAELEAVLPPVNTNATRERIR